MTTRRKVPRPLAHFYSMFPLVAYEDMTGEADTTPAPKKPTLWLLGPPNPSSSSSSSESLDPACRFVQTFAQLKGIDYDKRWLANSHGAPKSKLPALHLRDGALLAHDEIAPWLAAKRPRSPTNTLRPPSPATSTAESGSGTGPGGGAQKEKGSSKKVISRRPSQEVLSEERARTAFNKAYDSLIKSTLLPAVLANVYLVPANVEKLPIVHRGGGDGQPVLSKLASKYLVSKNERDEIIDEIRKLKGLPVAIGGSFLTAAAGSRSVLDLEKIEREGMETVALLENKIGEQGSDKWIGGSEQASELDAWILALLSIVKQLPVSRDNLMRNQLDKSPGLLQWLDMAATAARS